MPRAKNIVFRPFVFSRFLIAFDLNLCRGNDVCCGLLCTQPLSNLFVVACGYCNTIAHLPMRTGWSNASCATDVRHYSHTSKSDQFQISAAASPEILQHTVWRTCLFIAYSDKRWLYHTNPHHNTYTLLVKSLGEGLSWARFLKARLYSVIPD